MRLLGRVLAWHDETSDPAGLHAVGWAGYDDVHEEGTMRQTTTLSDAALALLCRRVAREPWDVTDETRPLYRERAEVGLMVPLHTMTGGDESAYRLTEAGVIFASRP